MDQCLTQGQGFRLVTAHGTQLAVDPATGGLRHGPAGNDLVGLSGHRLGPSGVVLVRDDGCALHYPRPGLSFEALALPIVLKLGPNDAEASIGLPGQRWLTAVPDGSVENNRMTIGGWELFKLQATDDTPALATMQDLTNPDSLCRDPTTDPGIVAALLTDMLPEQVRALIPQLSQRSDYAHLFPFARTVVSGGAERSGYDTQTHLQAGIAAHGWIVGDHTYGHPTIVDGQYGPVRIGRYCSIAGEVRIIAANHLIDAVTTYPFVALRQFWPSAPHEVADHSGNGVLIGNAVWLGAGATILPGANIGDGAIVGAQAVVAGVVPPFAVAVGNPARVTRRLFDEVTISRLLAVGWWDWPDSKVDRFVALLLNGDVDAFLEHAEQER